LLFTAVLRLPSLNALEGEAKRAPFQRLLGRRVPDHKLFSADTAARSLDSLAHEPLRRLLYDVVWQAERNKAFRDGPVGARRCVALDGWQAFSSYHRRCDHCLTRQVRTAQGEITQYYHSFVVAYLLGKELELVLDFEPLRPADLRRKQGQATDHHDGEQTAALRLLERLHTEFGSFIDLFVLDALYANGPMMTRLSEYDYGAIITVKKETDEPLKDALAIMRVQPSRQSWTDEEKREHIEVWDVDQIKTLDTFKGQVRVVRADVSSIRTGKTTTWCAAVVGARARQLPARTVHRVQRMRWHEENTAFKNGLQSVGSVLAPHPCLSPQARSRDRRAPSLATRLQPDAALRLPAAAALPQTQGPLRHHPRPRRRDGPGRVHREGPRALGAPVRHELKRWRPRPLSVDPRSEAAGNGLQVVAQSRQSTLPKRGPENPPHSLRQSPTGAKPFPTPIPPPGHGAPRPKVRSPCHELARDPPS
jgi:hypothetical protein